MFAIGTHAGARTVNIEGVGILIKKVDDKYRYKSDHLDTADFGNGLIFPKSTIPSWVAGKEYACIDWRPASDDSRTNDVITRIKADAAGDLLIAMPSAGATNNGWYRYHNWQSPEFYLDNADRDDNFTPDTGSPYYLYKHAYTTPGTWVNLPTNSVTTDKSPFVFAEIGELNWDNPPPLMGNAVTIAKKPEGEVATTNANPSFIIRSNGDYLAMVTGVISSQGDTSVWRSTNQGASWTELASGFKINVCSLFELSGNIYLIGDNTSGSGNTRIYRSTNNGATWTTSVFTGSGGGDAPSHVYVQGGLVWKAGSGAVSGGYAGGFYSASTSADLMQESSWTLSLPSNNNDVVLSNGQRAGFGDENDLIKSKEGVLFTLGRDYTYRPEDGWLDGFTTKQPNLSNLTQTTLDPNYAGPRLPGNGNGKCTGIYDATSGKYWALTSGINRGQLNLYSATTASGRINDFQFVATVLDSESSSYEGFNYPFMQIAGNDLVYVLRTAWNTNRGRSSRWHNGNLFTFHRIKNFRTITPGNTLANPGLEEGIGGWYSESPNGTASAAIWETGSNTRTGIGKLTHASSSAHTVYTYKTVQGIPNGNYTLKAWVRCGSGATRQLVAENYGGAKLTQTIPVGSAYTQVVLPGIYVTNGTCRIGISTTATGGSWMNSDDFEFVATPTATPTSGKTYIILAKHSQRAMNVEGNTSDPGANVCQWGRGAGDNSKWILADVGGGYFRVTAKHSGLALNVYGNSTADDANIQQYPYGGGSYNMQWMFIRGSDGYYKIISRRSGKALYVAGADLDDLGNIVQRGDGNGVDNARWSLIETQ